MKRRHNKKFCMTNFTNITAVLDEPSFLENFVERLATRRYDIGYSNQRVPKNWQAIDTSSTEIYVSGTLSLAGDDGDEINMPFTTPMLFTCAKGKEDSYRLMWSSSLS